MHPSGFQTILGSVAVIVACNRAGEEPPRAEESANANSAESTVVSDAGANDWTNARLVFEREEVDAAWADSTKASVEVALRGTKSVEMVSAVTCRSQTCAVDVLLLEPSDLMGQMRAVAYLKQQHVRQVSLVFVSDPAGKRDGKRQGRWYFKFGRELAERAGSVSLGDSGK